MKNGKRFLALLLSFAMIVTLLPSQMALAATGDEGSEAGSGSPGDGLPDKLMYFSFDERVEDGDSVTATKNGNNAIITTTTSERKIGKGALHLSNNSFLSIAPGILKTEKDGKEASIDELTISYWSKVSIAESKHGSGWIYFASEGDGAGADLKYIGLLDRGRHFAVECFNGSRVGTAKAYSTGTESGDTKVDATWQVEEWKQVVIVMTPEKLQAFINGQKVAETTDTNGAPDLTQSTLYIGKATWGSGEYFTGYIDEFTVYDGALDEDEVKQVYEGELLKDVLGNGYLTTKSLTMGVGKTKTIGITTSLQESVKEQIKFESENPKIATVDSTGKVTAVSVGETKIKAKLSIPGAGDHTNEVSVKVRSKAEELNAVGTYKFDTDGDADGASAVNSGLTPHDGALEYVAGHNGMAVKLPGIEENATNTSGYGYGLKLKEERLGPDYTVSMWINPEAGLYQNGPILAIGNPSPTPKEDWLAISGKWLSGNATSTEARVWASGGKDSFTNTKFNVTNGKWMMLTISQSGNDVNFYLDGKPHGSATAEEIMNREEETGLASAIYLGVTNWDRCFKGLIDDVYVYDSALDASQVATVFMQDATEEELADYLGILGENESIYKVKSDLELPTEVNGINIKWTSDNEDKISKAGKLQVPVPDGSAVKLTAACTYAGITKEYEINVKLALPVTVNFVDTDQNKLQDSQIVYCEAGKPYEYADKSGITVEEETYAFISSTKINSVSATDNRITVTYEKPMKYATAQLVDAIGAVLVDDTYTLGIKDDTITLPGASEADAAIAWTASWKAYAEDGTTESSVINTETGAVTKPATGTATVILKATLTVGEETKTIAVTCTVGTPVEISEADQKALDDALESAAEYEGKQSTYTAASWNIFSSALSQAKAQKNFATSVEAVKSATTALTGAIESLVERGDKTSLDILIANADALVETDYTSGWNALVTALTDAKTVQDKNDAEVSKTEVDAAVAALQTAIGGLTAKAVVKTDLTALIAEAKTFLPNSADYTEASWDKLTDALEKAEAAAEAATLQSKIDKAKDALQEAIDGLTETPGNTADLLDLITESEKLKEADYTSSTWSTFKDALAAANKIMSAATVPVQSKIDEAKDALQQAKDALVTKPGDKSELTNLVTAVGSLTEGDYDADSWKDLQDALAAANALSATATQSEIDAAKKALQDAKDDLVRKDGTVDKTALNALIAEAEALHENDYTMGSWDNLQTALTTAKALADNATQQEVNAARRALDVAKEALVTKPGNDKEGLTGALGSVEKLIETDYNAESWQTLQAAIRAAQELSPNAVQSEIDKAASDLQAAIDALVKKTPDKTALNTLIASVDDLVSTDYTSDSWSGVTTALTKANTAVESATLQSEIDKAKADLEEAIDALVKKTVDKSDLQDLIDTVESAIAGKTEADYASGWSDLQAALTTAKSVNTNEEATWTQVDNAYNTLNSANQALVPYVKVTGITVAPEKVTLTLGKNATQQLTATVAPGNATNKDVTWSSADNEIAEVSESGLVTAKSVGTVTITATSVADATKTASCEVTVQEDTSIETDPTVAEVTLSPTKVELIVGDSKTLTASVKMSDGTTTQAVKWSTSDDKIATVAEGKVTAVKAGKATITAVSIADPTKKATCEITVNEKGGATPGQDQNPVKSVKLNVAKKITIGLKEKVKLTATVTPKDATNKTVEWKSSSPKVVEIKKGTITGKKTGKATITATAGGKKATCAVTVKPAPTKKTKISVAKKITIKVKKSQTLKPKVKGNFGCNTFKFTSKSKKIAKVDANGKVTGVKKGSTKITVTTYNKKAKATVNVTVK